MIYNVTEQTFSVHPVIGFYWVNSSVSTARAVSVWSICCVYCRGCGSVVVRARVPGHTVCLRACFTKCICRSPLSSELNEGSSRQKRIHIPLRLWSITCDLMWKNRSTSRAGAHQRGETTCTADVERASIFSEMQNFNGCLLLAPVNAASW